MKKILLLIIMSSCSQRPESLSLEGSPFEADAQSDKVLLKSSLSDARSLLKKAKLQCSTSKCPPQLALMVSVFTTDSEKENSSYFIGEACTASAVKIKNKGSFESYFLTAGACVPKRLSEGADCSEDILFVTSTGIQIPCQKVEKVFASSEKTPASDFSFEMALIKVKLPENMPTYDLNEKGLRPSYDKSRIGDLKSRPISHPIKVFSVDVNSSWETSLTAQLSDTQCWYLQNSFLVPESRDSRSPLFVLRNCSVTKSSAGAPVLDGDSVVGVISSKLATLPKQTLVPSEGYVGIASNTSCLSQNALTNKCEDSMKLLYKHDESSLNHLDYLNKAITLHNRGEALSEKTLKLLDLIQEQKAWVKNLPSPNPKMASRRKKNINYTELPGYGGGWAFVDFPTLSGKFIRIPVPACYKSDLKIDDEQKYNINALEYIVDIESDLRLSLSGKLQSGSVHLIHTGAGTFALGGIYWGSQLMSFKLKQCGT